MNDNNNNNINVKLTLINTVTNELNFNEISVFWYLNQNTLCERKGNC